MGAQLFGTDPYQQMSGLAAKHGGPGAGQLFDQQTAGSQYQQGLNRQGQAAGGLNGIAQLLAYMHQRKAGQNGQPQSGNPLQQPSHAAPQGSAGLAQQGASGQMDSSGVNWHTGGQGASGYGYTDRMGAQGMPGKASGDGQHPAQGASGGGLGTMPPFVQFLMHLHQASSVGGNPGQGYDPMNPAGGQLYGSQWSNPNGA